MVEKPILRIKQVSLKPSFDPTGAMIFKNKQREKRCVLGSQQPQGEGIIRGI
jgi:hypothetical protein